MTACLLLAILVRLDSLTGTHGGGGILGVGCGASRHARRRQSWPTPLATGTASAVVVAALVAKWAQPVPPTAGLQVLLAADAVLAAEALERGLLEGALVGAAAALLLHERRIERSHQSLQCRCL